MIVEVIEDEDREEDALVNINASVRETEIVKKEEPGKSNNGWAGDVLERTDMETVRYVDENGQVVHLYIISGVEKGTNVQTIIIHKHKKEKIGGYGMKDGSVNSIFKVELSDKNEKSEKIDCYAQHARTWV